MGGLAQGGAASHRAVGVFLESYVTKSADEDIPRALLRAVGQANAAVVAYARSIDLDQGVGTTLSAAVVHHGSLYWISVGDSRVYLFRAGELAQVTTDHVYAAELETLVANGRMSREEARSHPDREALTSHLGLKYPRVHRPEYEAVPAQRWRPRARVHRWVLSRADSRRSRATHDRRSAGRM